MAQPAAERETGRPGSPGSLAEALAAIRDGDLSQTRLARLSDLSRDGVKELATVWPSIPEKTRIELVRRCDELSEERVELNFGRALRVALTDPSSVVRQLAIAGLWEDESRDLLDTLRTMLATDESPDVRAEAAAALGRFSSAAANGSLDDAAAAALQSDLLRAATDATSPYAVRRRALESLGPLAGEDEISTLIGASYDSGDHGLQCSAIYAMGRSLDPRWLPILAQVLDSEEPELRFEAARAAGQLGSPDALVGLLNAARDDDAEVRHTAIGAIGQIGGRGAVRALERLAEDADEADLELIEAAIDDVNALIEPISPQS